MRIVIDLTGLDRYFSGLERYCLNISKELIMLDNESEFILIFNNNIYSGFKDIVKRKNVKYKILTGKSKLLVNQIKLPLYLYTIKADVYIFLAFPSPILFRKKGIINAIHDLTPWFYPKTMPIKSRLYFKLAIRNAINVSQKIITVSKNSLSDIKEKFHIENISVIYNGVSDSFTNFKYDSLLCKKILSKYNIKRDYILCLCTVEPRKNIRLLLEAYDELNLLNCGVDLILIGRRGWMTDGLFDNGLEHLKDKVIFTGFVDEGDLPYIYKSSKLFVFPSIYEGFGLPPLEAMSMSVPVIVSNSSSLPEVVGNGGLMFENNNKEDLKDKIKLLLYNDEKREYISNKAHVQASKFNWTKEASKLNKLIKKMT